MLFFIFIKNKKQTAGKDKQRKQENIDFIEVRINET